MQALYFLQSISSAYAGGLIYQTALPSIAKSSYKQRWHPVGYGVT